MVNQAYFQKPVQHEFNDYVRMPAACGGRGTPQVLMLPENIRVKTISSAADATTDDGETPQGADE